MVLLHIPVSNRHGEFARAATQAKHVKSETQPACLTSVSHVLQEWQYDLTLKRKASKKQLADIKELLQAQAYSFLFEAGRKYGKKFTSFGCPLFEHGVLKHSVNISLYRHIKE